MIWIETLLILALSWLAAICVLGLEDTRHDVNFGSTDDH